MSEKQYIVSYGTKNGDQYWDLRGNSKAQKPGLAATGELIPNGSEFTETDTGIKYMYDAIDDRWSAQSAGTGGGSAPTLPVATETTLGGIKASDTVVIDPDGTAHAVATEISEESFATDEEFAAVMDDVFGEQS